MCLKVRSSEIQRSLKKQKKPLNAQHFHNSFLRFTQLHQQSLDQVNEVCDCSSKMLLTSTCIMDHHPHFQSRCSFRIFCTLPQKTKLLLKTISIYFFSPNNLWTLSSSLRAKSERWKDGTVRVNDVKHSWAHPNITVLFCYNTLDNKGEKVRHC